MIIVIQCQSKKYPGGNLRSAEGKSITFVAQPNFAPKDGNIYKRPDDDYDNDRSWRDVLEDYNSSYNSNDKNPLGLYRAYELYRNSLYKRLAEHPSVGMGKLYILSAGWGIIPAIYLTPYYDITFSPMPADEKYKQRHECDQYCDFNKLPTDPGDQIVFFGSRRYLSKFCKLANGIRAEKIVFYNSDKPPGAPGYTLRKYPNAKRDTNWQFDCANDFLNGAISI